MKGPGLSKVEQASYVRLDELKSEIEADYDRYWRGSGVDRRPLKPVAQGTRPSNLSGQQLRDHIRPDLGLVFSGKRLSVGMRLSLPAGDFFGSEGVEQSSQ